jgi:hypothetical protein
MTNLGYSITVAENGFMVYKSWSEENKYLNKTYIFITKDDLINWLRETI